MLGPTKIDLTLAELRRREKVLQDENAALREQAIRVNNICRSIKNQAERRLREQRQLHDEDVEKVRKMHENEAKKKPRTCS